MKVYLAFPPNWTPTMPHLALPTLTASLRQAGVDVIQRDLNLELFDEILTRDHVQRALDLVRERQRDGQMPRQRVQQALRDGPRLATQVERAKDVIRSEAFFDGPIGLRAFETVMGCLEIASLPYYPASLTLQSYSAARPVDSSRTLLELVRDEEHNLFLDLYRRLVLPDLERERPDVVGISIPSMPQMLAGMTLGHLIKEAGLDCHVVVGGPHISMLREQIAQVPRVFELFDSAVVFDGEVPLLRLVEALEGEGNLSEVPNLIFNESWQSSTIGDIHMTARKEPEKIVGCAAARFRRPAAGSLPRAAPRAAAADGEGLLLWQVCLLQRRLRRAGILQPAQGAAAGRPDAGAAGEVRRAPHLLLRTRR